MNTIRTQSTDEDLPVLGRTIGVQSFGGSRRVNGF